MDRSSGDLRFPSIGVTGLSVPLFGPFPGFKAPSTGLGSPPIIGPGRPSTGLGT